MTGKRAEKMRQGIEKKQETVSVQNSVTVMFHDGEVFCEVPDMFFVRGNSVP